MPQQTDPAVPMRLPVATSQDPSHLPQKIRVAGRLAGPYYDPSSPFIELTDGKCSLRVDISLCLEPFKSSPWLVEKHALVMFMGLLEAVPEPILRPWEAAGNGHTTVLRALIGQETSDLQLGLWDRAIIEREELESLHA